MTRQDSLRLALALNTIALILPDDVFELVKTELDYCVEWSMKFSKLTLDLEDLKNKIKALKPAEGDGSVGTAAYICAIDDVLKLLESANV